MKVFILIAGLIAASNAGLITHHEDHGKATSYQNIEFKHFHAVPTYIKKEDSHLLKHPLPAGNTNAKLEVHHGGKHDHGYAFAHSHSDVHGLGLGLHGFGYDGHEDHGGHEALAHAALQSSSLGHHGYDVNEHHADLGHLGGDEGLGHEQHASLGLEQHASLGLEQHASLGHEGLGLGHYH